MCYQDEFLKNRFSFSVYDICVTEIVPTSEAFINPTGSLIEQMDCLQYSDQDIGQSVHILDAVLDKIVSSDSACCVLGINPNNACNEISNVRQDIHIMFDKLENNYNDIAASNDNEKRKIEYKRLLTGFRLIAQILSSSDLPNDAVALGIIAIRESSKHCMSNWKLTLISLMISYESQIKNILKDKGVVLQKRHYINGEEDRIYELLLNAFYNAKNSVSQNLISKFINNCDIFEGAETHYRDVCISFLNSEYGLNLLQLEDVSENLLSSVAVEKIQQEFKKFLQRTNILEMVFDDAIKNCTDEIRKCPSKINQLMDWLYMYLKCNDITYIQKDMASLYEFVENFITRGEYNCELKFAALKEMMVFYNLITIYPQDIWLFKEKRILQKLLDVPKDDINQKSMFKNQILCILKNNLDKFIIFTSNPLVKSYDMFGVVDLQNLFTNKSEYEHQLLVSCMYSNDMITNFLIDNGCMPNACDVFGFSALMYACEFGNLSQVKYLISHGADINMKDTTGKTALIVACCKNYCDIILYLLEHGANINQTDSLGWSPLIVACTRDNFDVMSTLVEGGANINHMGEESCTALMYACDKNNFAIVEYLVEHGADVNMYNTHGWTPLLIACSKNNLKLVKYLVTHGANVNHESVNKFTPLITACEQDDVDVVSYLIECGADVNHANIYGWTALLVAAKNNNENILNLLVNNGASITACNKSNNNALLYACDNNNTKLATYLIDAGVCVNQKNDKHWTPLLIACSNNNYQLAMYLVKHGANVNDIGAGEVTPLGIACSNSNFELMKFLLENFASIDMLNSESKFKINLLMCQNTGLKTNISVDIQHSIQNGDIDKLTNCLDRYMMIIGENDDVQLWEMVNCINFLDSANVACKCKKTVDLFKKYIVLYIKNKISCIAPVTRKRNLSHQYDRGKNKIKVR